MHPPFVDLHTHRRAPETGTVAVRSHRLGRGESLPPAPFTAGVHPWDVGAADFSVLDFFDEDHSGLIGVGEIGLDFSREIDKNLQSIWLEKQLTIAEKKPLPVVLHCVRAYNETIAALKKHRLQSVVFHGFTGSPELAGQLAGAGCFLSFSPKSFHSPRTVEVVKTLPATQFFLETDDDPGTSIEEMYTKAAVLRGTTVEALKEKLYRNYTQFVIRN